MRSESEILLNLEYLMPKKGLVWLKLGNEVPVGLVHVTQLQQPDEFEQLDENENITGYYTIKPVVIRDGRKLYRSKRPLSIFSAHGERIDGQHTLPGMNQTSIDSQAVINELNETVMDTWNLPPIELFISCDENPHTDFNTRWDMLATPDNTLVSFALGKNMSAYDQLTQTMVLPLDIMRRVGTKFDITKNKGLRRAKFDELFQEEHVSIQEWIKWVIYREREYQRLKRSNQL